MIKDIVTNTTYESEPCRYCGGTEIYVCHLPNPQFPDDISKDEVFCRCERCRHIPTEKWDSPLKFFNNVKEAIDFWNKKNSRIKF